MNRRALLLTLCLSAACSYSQSSAQTSAQSSAQTVPQNISAAQLQKVLDLPLDQAIKLRDTHKLPLKAAYAQQIVLTGKDCQSEIQQGQQPYNICMCKASVEADQQYAVFYNNLQYLCHSQQELTTLHALEITWLTYKDSAIRATHTSWPDGTGASGLASLIYLSLIRDHMHQLSEIYGLQISQ